MFARSEAIAASLHEYLRQKLEEVKKIALLQQTATLDDCLDLERQTVIVTSDEILKTTLDLGFSAVPLIIHFNMAVSRQVLLARLSKARRGFNSQHIARLGKTELRTDFVIPIGQIPESHDQFISREQFEDLKLFLKSSKAKIPSALDILDLNEKEFDCSRCYAVGEHRDRSRFDCPEAQV